MSLEGWDMRLKVIGAEMHRLAFRHRCVLNLMLYFYVPEVENGGLQEMLQ